MPDQNIACPAAALASARRIVVKVGSALLIDGERRAASAWMAGLAEDIAASRTAGTAVVLVSSGAIALGRARLPGGAPRIADKQAAAAIGQSMLIEAWGRALAPHGITPAQILLTSDDTERRRRWLNARATIEALLDHGALPIVNENDTVATEEIRYGDNDRLAARTAQLARADLLILLSDVDGLYTADPRDDPDARHMPLIEAITPDILARASGPNRAAGVGTGGMATKLDAARIARAAGCATIVAAGGGHRPLTALADGARATLFTALASPIAAYKQWIAGSLAIAGSIRLDAGAAAAVAGGKSVLPAGIAQVDGRFDKGECVALTGPDGRRVGIGIAAYPAADIVRLIGAHSDRIEALIGYRGPSAVVHCDDLVRDEP